MTANRQAWARAQVGELAAGVLDAMVAQARGGFPEEICGILLGPETGPADEAVPLVNVQNKYHKLDPVGFPRDARTAFRFNDMHHLKALQAAREKGRVQKAIYHSHCDCDAYFSAEDRAMALHEGSPVYPGVYHVVVSVYGGELREINAHVWDPESGDFVAVKLR